MLSIQEVVGELVGAITSGKEPNLDEYRDVQVGETVRGIVDDPMLLSMIAIRDAWWADFFLRWPQQPKEPGLSEALATGAKLEELDNALLEIVRRAMGLDIDDRALYTLLRKRAGNLVVATKPRRRMILVHFS